MFLNTKYILLAAPYPKNIQCNKHIVEYTICTQKLNIHTSTLSELLCSSHLRINYRCTYCFHYESNCDRKTESQCVHCEKCLSYYLEVVCVVGVRLVLQHVVHCAQTEHYCCVDPKWAITLFRSIILQVIFLGCWLKEASFPKQQISPNPLRHIIVRYVEKIFVVVQLCTGA